MIPLYKAYIPDEALRLLPEVFRNGQIADGGHVRDFERALQAYIGNPNVVTAGDVSSALVLCLLLAGVKPGDEVLASPMACVATNQPILNVGAKVVWCDVHPRTGMPDATALESALTGKTRAILYPFWAGDVPQLDAINAFARDHNLAVIEDAGEALGAEYRGRRVGNTGSDYTVFSFHAIRHITTGEGAAVAFRDAATAEHAQWLKRYGIHRPTFRDEWGEIRADCNIREAGLNSYLTNVAGAIGMAQMARLPGIVEAHRRNAMRLESLIRDVPGINLCERPAEARSAFWVYTLLAERRDDLLKALRGRGVYASKVHLRNDTYSCFGPGAGAALSGLDWFAARYLCVPCGWWLNESDVEAIGAAIRQGW